jgi:hypothetical protein
MTMDPGEAAASLRHIAAIEQRTREAVFYGGSSAICILWGLLIACGYVLAELQPRSAGVTWLAVSAAGCVATTLIAAARMRTGAHEVHDWRLLWAMLAVSIFGVTWSLVLGPVVPRPFMYAFQPSLFMLGMVLAGLWAGRFFIWLGAVSIAAMLAGYLLEEPWLRLWMAVVQSGTLILGGVWLRRNGVRR